MEDLVIFGAGLCLVCVWLWRGWGLRFVMTHLGDMALVRQVKGGGVVVLQGYWELEGTYMLDHCPW